jgi:glycosyltransferase involved in cell wall biosynthesis
MKNEEGIMKVMMLLSNPFMVDPRVYKEAKALVDVGHEVTVIVWDRKNEYESVSVVEGIRIVRIHNTGIMKILPLDLFKNPLWWRKAFKKALKLYDNGFRFDVVHCHDLDTLKSGVWLKNKLGIKLVYDAHEIFGYMMERDMPKFIVNFALKLEKKLVKHVDSIITVNEPVEKYLRSITDKPITIVMNCNDVISKTYQPTKNDVCTISYIGVLHKSRMFPELVDIIGKIKNVRFVIAGKKENLYDEVKSRCEKYDNITFLGSIPFNEVIPKTLESDVVVCMINPNDMNNKIALANKQFEAIVCGRPIICTKNTYSGDMTEKLQCGLVVDYNLDAIKEAIIKLRDDPKLCEKLGRNGLKAAIDKYNWNEQKKKLLAVCSKLN